MEKNIFDIYSKEEIEDKVNEIHELIEDGLKDEEILDQVSFELKDELISLARARKKAAKEMGKYIGDIEYFNLDDLRFSTPVNVADYRAKRLKCEKIVDLCSGIGIQAASFSKTCKEVYAFEIDPRKVKYSQENFSHNKNIQFFVGDVLDDDIIEKIREIKPDVIFCDPERLPSEKERTLSSIKPGINKLIEVYSKITPNLCLEIPPQMDIGKLKELGEFEAEYLSLDNKLNRLDLYFGSLSLSVISVVDITSGARVERSKKIISRSRMVNQPMKYIYEVSPAIIKARLEAEFSNLTESLILEGSEEGKLLLTTGSLSENEALKLCQVYKVVGFAESFFEISNTLRAKGFGKVVLKYSIDPKDYWKERNTIENRLKGKREAVLFTLENRGNKSWIICEKA